MLRAGGDGDESRESARRQIEKRFKAGSCRIISEKVNKTRKAAKIFTKSLDIDEVSE